MTYPFAEILLQGGAESYAFENGFDGEKRLRPLAKLNVFVGANNSGKSRLMRAIASIEKLSVLPNFGAFGSSVSYDEIHAFFSELKGQVLTELRNCGCTDVNGVRGKIEIFPLGRFLVEGGNQIEECIQVLEQMARWDRPTQWEGNGNHQGAQTAVANLQTIARKAIPKLPISEEARSIPQTKKLYIPTLRSLRDLGGGDGFGDRTKADYFSNAGHVEIFTGRTLYSDIEQLVRGDLNQRATLRKFEAWLSETFFRGEAVTIIPRILQTTLTIKIGDEKEQPIHNLGDGIQAILILAFPLFVRENEHLLVFIEEPELFLHPWLQRVLLEMLHTRFPRHQYFFTTHSNHFLDLTLEIESVSVFAFEKHLEEKSELEKPPRYTVTNVSRSDRRPLELLGVRNSSVLLTNCTIWVEGITDRRYLAHWISLYQQQIPESVPNGKAKYLKEDLHFSFVEYSGGNITHWSFLDEEGTDVERLCGKLFLIADNDGADPESARGKRHAKLAAKLGDSFCLLPTREIENLLTPEILKLVLEAYGEASDNLNEPKQEDYVAQKLGEFIEGKIIKDSAKKKRKGSYAGDSGTVSDKMKFSERAIAAMKSFDSLSLDAQELTKRVVAFIERAQQS